ncbi:TetR family transcriptional regulator [Salisediminibacterium halotolerans]|uniref:TetR family transcriptional regulator n=1 Tax=Salisediminibacterium halotolerans TaxID=517425 RepID=UPI000F1E2472|nr:TetR family transcriptional regulator [Salisediminibacterium halotolerans]RLJ71746.1 TetR family transcriptional regulator [Actinophytocola xinjiangensis]RPE86896.1 TetR family transcriptional regulator [Salisediminibacterium halotolerans]TWG32959.1 TetR family transcriptional regulator [Salisediminibacterium halotolerans]GEL08657.1 putative HTH-type transcriptional regulator YvdT [Salisediminibacterium halotolerans]
MSADKRSLLINTAIDVIREQGFEKTSVSQIVGRAGVAQGTFYLYFKTKNELIPAIAREIFDIQLDRTKEAFPKEPASLDELLKKLIEITYTITEEYKDLITFIYSGMAFYHSFETWEQIYAPYYEWLMSKFVSLQDTGEIQTDTPFAYAANYTVGFIEHAAESFYLSGALSENPEQSKHECFVFLRRALQP